MRPLAWSMAAAQRDKRHKYKVKVALFLLLCIVYVVVAAYPSLLAKLKLSRLYALLKGLKSIYK